jgi:hypothetical protein
MSGRGVENLTFAPEIAIMTRASPAAGDGAQQPNSFRSTSLISEAKFSALPNVMPTHPEISEGARQPTHQRSRKVPAATYGCRQFVVAGLAESRL